MFYDLHITADHIDTLLEALSDHLVSVSNGTDERREALAADLLRRGELLSAYATATEDAENAQEAYEHYCLFGDGPADDTTNSTHAGELQRLMERHKAWGLEAVPLKVATAEGDTTTDEDTGVHYYTSSPRLKVDGVVPPDAKQDTKEEIIARCPPEARDALKAWLNREWEQKEAPSNTAKAIPRPF